MEVGLGFGIASEFVEGCGSLVDCDIILWIYGKLGVEVGHGLLIFMLHHVDVGPKLQGLESGVDIVFGEIFQCLVDIIESLDVVVLFVIFICATEECLGVTRVFVEELVVGLHHGLGHRVEIVGLGRYTERCGSYYDGESYFSEIHCRKCGGWSGIMFRRRFSGRLESVYGLTDGCQPA